MIWLRPRLTLTRRHLVLAIAAAAVVTVARASTAAAGEYPVYACEPAFGDVNHSWVAERSSSRMSSYSNCPVPWNEPRDWNRGLVTLHPTSGPTGDDPLGLLEYAGLRFRAPAGASLARMRYSHLFCGASTFKAGLLNDANQWLHASSPGTCGTVVPSPFTLSLGGTRSVLLATMCAETRCNASGNERAYASMRSATVWVSDSTPPAVGISGGSLAAVGWHRGTQSLVATVRDNVGVRRAGVFLDSVEVAGADGNCDWTYAVPCATPLGTMRVDSSVASDGQHTLSVRALDSADNWGSTSARVFIDNTAPPSPLDPGVIGGESWRRTNAFSVAWTNPSQPGTAPISGVIWQICPVLNAPEDARGCASGRRAGRDIHAVTGVRVPGPGDWTARFWLVDAAGNNDQRSARAVHLRYDPDVPGVELLAPDPADPQRVSVAASDALSGLARVEVEIRRDTNSAWLALPVAAMGGQFVAHFDDAALPRGHYFLRARAVDLAGNERSTDRRGGTPAALDLPVRLETAMSVGEERTIRRRHGRRRTVLRRRPLAAFGRRVSLRGRVSVPGGNPLGGADVQVFEQTALPGEPWRWIGLVRTGPGGAFAFTAPPGPTRMLRFAYAGTPLIRPSSADLNLRVRAHTSFDVNRRHVVNGDAVRFQGRVRGRMPESGKLLQLQAYSRGTWRTFATPRASRRTHRWHYWYRFSATRGVVRYRFRAVVPTEAGFPYVRGASHSVRVTVRGL